MRPLRISGANLEGARESLRKAFSRVSAEICYCSTLDECWMMSGSARVDACPAGGMRFQD